MMALHSDPIRRHARSAASARGATEPAATSDASFAALESALARGRGVAQQHAFRQMADASPAVQDLARLQRMIARPEARLQVPVVQRVLTLSTRNWSEAMHVTVLHKDVFQVDGRDGGSLVIKTAADMDSTLDEYVGARLGQMMGVNTIDTVAVRIDSSEVKDAIPYFKDLGGNGVVLAKSIASSKHEFMLVMPFIEGSDLKKSKAVWENASPQQQMEWAEEMGKAWLLDLVLQNPDRHPENFRIDKSGKLYAFDQSVGPGLKDDFGPEKVKEVMKDVSGGSERYYDHLNSNLDDFTISRETFYAGFFKGVYEARAALEAITPETITGIYTEMTDLENVKLLGLEGVLAEIKEGLK